MIDLTPKRLGYMIERLGMTQDEFAKEIGVTRMTVYRWRNEITEMGDYMCQHIHNKLFRQLDEIGWFEAHG